MRYPATEKLEVIRLVEQSHLPVRRTLEKLGIHAPHSIVGMISIEQMGRRPWKIAAHGPTGCGTASPTR
jgi:hypothetical protein